MFFRIYFAASEFAKDWPGTIDGALESGESAAIFLLLHARPQVLNIGDFVSYRFKICKHFSLNHKFSTIFFQVS